MRYRFGIGIETRVLKNPGPMETRPFSQAQNPGLRAAETRVSGLCFSAAFDTFQQQMVKQFNAFSVVVIHKLSNIFSCYFCVTHGSDCSAQMSMIRNSLYEPVNYHSNTDLCK